MPKKTGPYIGVTGFMSRDEVLQALTFVSRETAYRLMVGALMSSKTLAGRPNKWPGRYPTREAIADIFVDDPRALNLIHYNTDNPAMLASEVRQIVALAGPNLDGFQFNVAWPAPSQIEQIREMYPDLYLLLQIGDRAMREVSLPDKDMSDMSMAIFKEALGCYIPHIDAILIDSSGGTGELLDVVEGAKWLRAAKGFGLEMGIAGGLGPITTHLIEPLAKEFPKLNIDAEGRLRTPQPDDALNMHRVHDHIVLAHLVLEGHHASMA